MPKNQLFLKKFSQKRTPLIQKKPKEKPNDFLLIEIHLNNLTKNRRNRVREYFQ